MLLRTKLYLYLTPIFGTPSKVTRENYTRTEKIYQTHTVPLLETSEGYFSDESRVLIIGCGEGIEIRWFAVRSKAVVAVDIDEGAVATSRKATDSLCNVTCRLIDANVLPFEDEEFDLIFMHNVCEHVVHVEECFADYYRVLKPGGVLVNSFSPLFYSPFGAHLQDALKIPWGHLIFGLWTIVEVRNCFYPGVATATSWRDLGLNRITEDRYRKIVSRCGFKDESYSIRISKKLPIVGHIPLLRNLFIMAVNNVLRKSGPKDERLAR